MTRVIDPIRAEYILDYCGGYVEVAQAMELFGMSKSFINKKFDETENLMKEKGIKNQNLRPRVVPLDILKEVLPLNESRIRKSAENRRRIQAQNKNAQLVEKESV